MTGVLVAGATTPLGRALIERLLETGHGPVLAAGVESADDAELLLPPGVPYQTVDLTRPREVRRLLFGEVRRLQITTVVNLAAHRDPFATGSRVHRLNVEAARLLLRLAEQHPTITRYIQRSDAAVYRARTDLADVVREDAPLELGAQVPQWLRDRVEVDVTVCARMGLSPVKITVLRMAEILAPDMGSQLWDWLSSRVCLAPLGYDPMIEVLSLPDAVEALHRALTTEAVGAFNIGGADVLPLSRAARLWGRDLIALPGPVLGPLYRARSWWQGGWFRYDVNRHRFHQNAVLDGARAEAELGYTPSHPIAWPGRTTRP